MLKGWLQRKLKETHLKKLGFYVPQETISKWKEDLEYITKKCKEEYSDHKDGRKRTVYVSEEYFDIVKNNRCMCYSLSDNYIYCRGFRLKKDILLEGRALKFLDKDDPKSYPEPPVPYYFYEVIIQDELYKYVKKHKKQPTVIYVNPEVKSIVSDIESRYEIKESEGLSPCTVLFM